MTCGRATCRRATDPDQRHGPHTQCSRASKGRTVNKMLSVEQLDRSQARIDNERRLRDLAHQLESKALREVQEPRANCGIVTFGRGCRFVTGGT